MQIQIADFYNLKYLNIYLFIVTPAFRPATHLSHMLRLRNTENTVLPKKQLFKTLSKLANDFFQTCATGKERGRRRL